MPSDRDRGFGRPLSAGLAVLLCLPLALAWTGEADLDRIAHGQAALRIALAGEAAATALQARVAELGLPAPDSGLAAVQDALAALPPDSDASALAAALRAYQAQLALLPPLLARQQALLRQIDRSGIGLGRVLQTLADALPGEPAAHRADHALQALLLARSRHGASGDAAAREVVDSEQARLDRELARLQAMPEVPTGLRALLPSAERQRAQLQAALAAQAAEQPQQTAAAAQLAGLADTLRQQAAALVHTQQAGRATASAAVARLVVAARLHQAALAAAALALGLLVAMLAHRVTTGPLRRLAAAMQRVAGGDDAMPLPELARRDALGAIARAFERQRRDAGAVLAAQTAQTTEALRARARQAEALAALSAQVDQRLDQFAERLGGVVLHIHDAAGAAGQGAAASGRQAQAVAERVARAAAEVQGVAAAADQLASAVRALAAPLGGAAEMAGQAAERARRSDEAVQGLTGAVERIGQVVAAIEGIAHRTRMVALNATIEAARAGESGLGFAVVAGEVKSLAAETAGATRRIGAEIAAIRGVSEAMAAEVGAIGQTVDALAGVCSTVVRAAEQQQAATAEVLGRVLEAGEAARAAAAESAGLAEGIAGVGVAARRVTALAEDVERQGQELREAARSVA